MGMLNVDILRDLSKADFERICEYIISMCELIVEEYEERALKLPNDENIIKNTLLEDYLKKNKKSFGMLEYRFAPEALEHYNGKGAYIGRTDIQIVLKTDFEKDDAYYIVECKRIDGSTRLNKDYVKKGIARFVSERYSSYYGRNIMLAFVVKNINISDNVLEIEMLQNNENNAGMHGTFSMEGQTRITESYICQYNTRYKDIAIRHIFTGFSSIVQ